jgi:PAS domain S-box-containing protein
MDHDDSLFRDICEHAQDLIQSVDADGHFVYVNAAWLKAMEYTADELSELHFLQILHPDSHAHCQAVFERVFRGEEVAPIAARFVTRSGRTFPVEGSISLRHRGGAKDGSCGIFRDVTEKQRARAEVDRLFELSLDMLCIAGSDGFFRRVNPAFKRVLGYGDDELKSQAFVEFVHPDDREDTFRAMEQLNSGKPVVDFRNRYRASDGSWHWLAWRSTPPDVDGNIYAVARDITEERQAQELIAQQAADLERSNADLEEFAYAASHDLQAPLRAIGNLSEWILDDMPDDLPDSVSRHLVAMRERIANMQQLINDLLAYSRAGRVASRALDVDTGALVESVIRLLAPPDGVAVTVEPGMPTIFTEPSPIEQVFRNLIGNAIAHHDRDTGSVIVAARRNDDWWEFSVADDGPGIPEEDRERVFHMFQRLEGGNSKGTGIGLALVAKIVDRVGGKVWVESGAERGSVFRFTWPDSRTDAED